MSNFSTVEEFEKRLKVAFWLATANSTLHKLRNALSVGALSWAVTFLLGGLTSNIPVSEHVLVSKLAAFVVCLRAVGPFSRNLLTRKVKYTGSINPVYLSYDDQQVSWVMVVQFVALFVEAVAFGLSVGEIWERMASDDFKHLSAKTFLLGHIWNSAIHAEQSSGFSTENVSSQCISVNRTCSESEGSFTSICFNSLTGNHHLRVSVLIFLKLTAWICIVTFCLALVFLIVWSCLEGEQRKYHDEVMRRGMADSIWRADEFDKVEVFLDSMGDDLAFRNIGPLEVKRQNSQVLDYLYHYPTGVERVLLGLTSSSVVRQQTAANIVGFWADKSDLKKKRALLSELAEKLGLPGKTAEAAANSFYALANEWSKEPSSPLLKIMVAKGDAAMATCHVVEKVVDLVREQPLPTLQVYMRVLDGFFKSGSVLQWLSCPDEDSRCMEIKDKLWNIAKRQSGFGRNSTAEAARAQPGGTGASPEVEMSDTEEDAQQFEGLTSWAQFRLLQLVEFLRQGVRIIVHTLLWVIRSPFLIIAWSWRCARREFRRASAADDHALLPRSEAAQSSSMEVEVRRSNIRTRTAFLAFSAWVRLAKVIDGGMNNDEESQSTAMITQLNDMLQSIADSNTSRETREVLWWDEALRFDSLWNEFCKAKPTPTWRANCIIKGKRFRNKVKIE